MMVILTKKFGITLVISLIWVNYLPLNAVAEIHSGTQGMTHSGTETIDKDDYWGFRFPISFGGSLYYTINVTNGLPIDVFLFDNHNFERYENNESGYQNISTGSQMNTTYLKVEVTVDSGPYYLVVDNTDKGLAIPPSDGVNNQPTFEYSIRYSSNSAIYGIVLGLISTVVMIVLFILLKSLKKDRHHISSYQQSQQNQDQYGSPLQQPTPQQPIQIKYCQYCNKQIPIDSKMCPFCGKK